MRLERRYSWVPEGNFFIQASQPLSSHPTECSTGDLKFVKENKMFLPPLKQMENCTSFNIIIMICVIDTKYIGVRRYGFPKWTLLLVTAGITLSSREKFVQEETQPFTIAKCRRINFKEPCPLIEGAMLFSY